MDARKAKSLYRMASTLFSEGKVGESREILLRLNEVFPNDRHIRDALERTAPVGNSSVTREACSSVEPDRTYPEEPLSQDVAETPSSVRSIESLNIDLSGAFSATKAAHEQKLASRAAIESRLVRTRTTLIAGALLLLCFFLEFLVSEDDTLFSLSTFVAFYAASVLPVVFGVRKAVDNGTSPNVMWVALLVPPISGWIAYFYLWTQDRAANETDAVEEHWEIPDTTDGSFAGLSVPVAIGCSIIPGVVLTALITSVTTLEPNAGLGTACCYVFYRMFRGNRPN